MGVKIELFEAGLTPLDFCLWGWIKSEVYKEKVNTRDELVARTMNSVCSHKARTPRRPQKSYTCYCQES